MTEAWPGADWQELARIALELILGLFCFLALAGIVIECLLDRGEE